MAKRSGLSFDPDLNSDILGLYPLLQPKTHNFLHHLHALGFQETHSFMDQSSSSPPPPTTIQFPVNLNCTTTGDHGDSREEKRKIIDEMDFFSDRKGCTDDRHVQEENTRVLDFNVNTGLRLLTAGNTGSDESIVDDGISSNSEDKKAKTSEETLDSVTQQQLTVLQAELERMNSENRRLKDLLNQVTNNYNGLQMHMVTLLQQKPIDHNGGAAEEHKNGNGLMVPRQFMDLGLAVANDTYEASLSSSEGRIGRDPPLESDKELGGGEDQSVENKVPRLTPSPKSVDQATEATMRKARVSVRARSEAPMITDGCQWRKYGQKMAKGNPCPRAYYRCTMAAGCPVRKQVQRCAEDRSILITTYEGNHNHPLPPAAMAMASTTSSAARMLLSGSMPSADGLINPNFLARTLLPCSSNMATISASAPFPTVTLDLTQPPDPFPRTPSNQFSIPFPNPPQNIVGHGNPAAALLPQIFGQALYNQSKFSGLQMSQDIEGTHQISSPLQVMQHQGQQTQLTDSVNAIANDPNFTAALAAAISSIIGGPYQENRSIVNADSNGNGNNKISSSSNFPVN